MKLTAYVTDGHTIDIRPAPAERAWMDDTENRHAYRCLPLTIANSHGWEILSPAGFSAIWNGGNGLDAVTVTPDVGAEPAALSHFGHGVLTFTVPCLFQTEPGFDLLVTGPINRPKDSIAPLTGLIETDWSPYTFHHELALHPAVVGGALPEGRAVLPYHAGATRRDRNGRA
jgi:hypothetical protein